MVVSERAINNIMGGMENTAGVRLHSHRHKLKQRFDIIRKLGQGTYGKVQLAINKETGQEVAIKTIKKAKIETEQDLIRIRREIQIMSSVQHPQIIHIYEVFENREKMVLVMEYAAGGELYDYLSERKVLPEEEARRVFRQVASAVYYCHKHKICHRDLKLENILLDLEGNAKIADFGLSNVFDEKQRLDTFCGSPLYASPEIVKGVPYVGPEVDCWSLGVLLYTLVYGAMPFDGTNFRRLVKQITQGDFYEPATPATASELVRQMLTTQSQERATVEDICSHWWVNEGYPVSCLTEAEKLANQTPVRLDLLLSLAPKQISSEHMLIQPEEDASTQTNAETAPVIKIPPPPPSEVNDDLGASPQKSSTFGTVTSSATGESVIEEKDKTKKEVASKKPPSIPPSNDDEKKAVKKKEPIDKDKIKKREASTERERSKIKKREPSTDRERVKSKSRDVSMDRATSKVRERSVEKPKTREEANDRPESARTKEKLRSERSSAERVKDQEKTVKKTELSSSRGSIRRPSTPKSGNQGESPSTRVKSKVESESKEKSSPKKSSESPKSTTSKPESKTSKVPEDIDDTEKILKETAAKIENVERLMNEEAKAADVQPMSLSSKEPPSPVTPITSPRNSISSSQAPSPVRSRTGSESSTEVNKSGSRSDSRRQSKILSKAAMFEAGLSQSPSADKPKKSHVTRPGTLNMTDLAKKFEEKPTTEKKNRVVTPNKVSDAKRAFEAKSEAGSRRVSVSSGKDESTSVSPKDSPKGSLSPTSPTTDQISSVPSSTTKTRETTSPVKKVVKSVSKEFSRDSSPKKEKSPTLSKVSKAVSKESKTVAKPTKPVVSQSQVSTKSRPTDLPKPSVEIVPVSSVATSKPKSSESSESESETEKVLKEVAEKRERVEMAKKAKLKSALDNSSTKSADRIPSNQGLESDSAVPAGRQDNVAQSRDVNESKDIAVRSSSHTKVPAVRRIPVVKEVVPIPPEQVLAPTPRSPTEETPRPIQKTEFINETPTKKSQVEIVLKKQAPERHPMASQISQNASRKEIRNERSGVFGEAHPEPHLQRARRERIIPIMIEQDDRDDAIEADIRSGSSRSSVTSNTSSIPKSSDSVIGIGRSQRKPQPSATIESIKKSRRERIIPIAVEGEGMMSPVISESGNSDTGKPIQESLSRNRAFNLDRADSFSSAGEDEEDEDDGFQILTAESLFSTLLSRVRSLTRKMANDDGRIVPINHVGTHRQEAPGSAEGPGNGTFWSSLYSPTRETGAGRVAGVLSRGSSQERDLFGDLGHPFWGRTTSRDGSDADSNTSDQSGPFSTLPRADFFRQPSLNWHHHKLIRDRFFSDFTRT